MIDVARFAPLPWPFHSVHCPLRLALSRLASSTYTMTSLSFEAIVQHAPDEAASTDTMAHACCSPPAFLPHLLYDMDS